MSVLVIAEIGDGEVKAATRSALAAASALGEADLLVLAGDDGAALGQAAASIAGVRDVLVASAGHLQHGLSENAAPAIAELVKAGGYSYLMAAATTTGKNLLPRVAALLDVQPISDISAVVEDKVFVRPIYAGSCMATVRTSQELNVVSVRTTAFDPVAAEGGSAQVREVDAGADAGLSSFVGEEVSESERPDLASARVVVSGGRGIQSKENFAILDGLADKLGAAIGASRAAVDSGFAPNDMQVGQTGKIVAPELYIAVGISGAIQHLAGMKDSKVIVAINKDEEAPIFQVADYGLVADLFTAVPELESSL